jgi:hypothetical protein
MMKINKFQFLAALALVQLFASSGFTRERPDRFAQDLGGNTVCSPTNNASPNSRCPMKVAAVSQTRTSASVVNSEEIPAPTSEDRTRDPSSIAQ